MPRSIPSFVPPRTSTFWIAARPFNPCNPSRFVVTFTLIGSKVMSPTLVFVTARELPIIWKSKTLKFVRFVLNTENVSCCGSGHERLVFVILMSIVPEVFVDE